MTPQGGPALRKRTEENQNKKRFGAGKIILCVLLAVIALSAIVIACNPMLRNYLKAIIRIYICIIVIAYAYLFFLPGHITHNSSTVVIF